MKKIIAIVLTVLTIISLTACGSKKANTTYTKRNEPWQEIDKGVKKQLGDMVLHTEYDDGIYYVFVSVEGINSTSAVKAYDFDDAFDGLSETIYDTKNVENVIVIMAYNNTSKMLYTTYNGNDITDYVN